MCVDANILQEYVYVQGLLLLVRKLLKFFKTGDQSSTWQKKGETEGAEDNLKPFVC